MPMEWVQEKKTRPLLLPVRDMEMEVDILQEFAMIIGQQSAVLFMATVIYLQNSN